LVEGVHLVIMKHSDTIVGNPEAIHLDVKS
jgi:hypothetical protein